MSDVPTRWGVDLGLEVSLLVQLNSIACNLFFFFFFFFLPSGRLTIQAYWVDGAVGNKIEQTPLNRAEL